MESNNPTKRYRFSGQPFEQKVLTYPEFEEAVRMCGKFIDDIQSITAFGVVLDKLIASGVLPDLIKLVIKPCERTIIHRIYYALKRKILKVDIVSPITLMNINEVAGVLRDFFTINTSSMSSLLLIESRLGLFSIQETPEKVSVPTN